MSGSVWHDVCGASDIEREDVRRYDIEGSTFAVYRAADGTFHATAGLCTHEGVHLADGIVIGDIIECAMHNGRFNIRTGKAMGAPACIDLERYDVKVEGGRVLIKVR